VIIRSESTWNDAYINNAAQTANYGAYPGLNLDARTSGTPGPYPYTTTHKSAVIAIPLPSPPASGVLAAANLVGPVEGAGHGEAIPGAVARPVAVGTIAVAAISREEGTIIQAETLETTAKTTKRSQSHQGHQSSPHRSGN
jgi:hypothetical protein